MPRATTALTNKSTLPVLNHQSSRTRPDHKHSPSSSSNVNEFGAKSSARYSNQHSIDSSAVYPPSSRESGQYTPPDFGVLRTHSLSTTATLSNNSIDPSSSPTSFPPVSPMGSKQTRRQSVGKKRKPAPVYILHSKNLHHHHPLQLVPLIRLPNSLLPTPNYLNRNCHIRIVLDLVGLKVNRCIIWFRTCRYHSRADHRKIKN